MPPFRPHGEREEVKVGHEESATGYRTENVDRRTSQAGLGFV